MVTEGKWKAKPFAPSTKRWKNEYIYLEQCWSHCNLFFCTPCFMLTHLWFVNVSSDFVEGTLHIRRLWKQQCTKYLSILWVFHEINYGFSYNSMVFLGACCFLYPPQNGCLMWGRYYSSGLAYHWKQSQLEPLSEIKSPEITPHICDFISGDGNSLFRAISRVQRYHVAPLLKPT